MIKFLFFAVLILLLIMLVRYMIGNIAGHSLSTTSNRHKSPYDVLEIKPGASTEEIRRAFRRLIKMYHPDNIPQHLAPELRALAEKRTKEINAAYKILLGRNGK